MQDVLERMERDEMRRLERDARFAEVMASREVGLEMGLTLAQCRELWPLPGPAEREGETEWDTDVR